MQPPNPEHLFEQAEHLANPSVGRPRDTDLRRSVSAAYYGLFHAISLATALKWSADRTSAEFALAYRNVDHGRLKTVCIAAKSKLSKEYGRLAGYEFGSDFRNVAEIVVELQELRNRADYDPQFSIRVSNARLAITRAKAAAEGFWHRVPAHEKFVLFSLLIFKQRL